jgi:hypothetical protein
MRRSRLVLTAIAALCVIASACSDDGDPTAATTTTAAPETTTTTAPPLEAGRQVFVYTPAVGQCFDRRQLEERPTSGPQQTDIVLVLDCSLPHENEVFDVLELPDAGSDYPGEPAMQAFARARCTANFAAFVGRSYETSALEVGYYLPSSNEWDSGARRLGCYVYDVNGEKLVGSIRGSGR